MAPLRTKPNPDLEVLPNNMSRLTHAATRRRGFHHLDILARYALSFRAARVWELEAAPDAALAEASDVKRIVSHPAFSALVVLRDDVCVLERYAADFGPDQRHSIQSITKTFVHLIAGALWEDGKLSLSDPVERYVPEIGAGYRGATLQDLLNMGVANAYREDFADPTSTYFVHEEAMGWRLPSALREIRQRDFLCSIKACGSAKQNVLHYKDATTEVLGWVIERAAEAPLRMFLADIVDAAGLEHALSITTDRDGVPCLSGGASMTARDLARYFALFARRGKGVLGQAIGSADFLARTLVGGIPLRPETPAIRYSNHLRVVGDCVAHSGWCGQYATASLKTGTVAVLLSVLDTPSGLSPAYMEDVTDVLGRLTQNGDVS